MWTGLHIAAVPFRDFPRGQVPCGPHQPPSPQIRVCWTNQSLHVDSFEQRFSPAEQDRRDSDVQFINEAVTEQGPLEGARWDQPLVISL